MKRFALLMLVMACVSSTAFAEDIPAFDVFGGFSLIHRTSGGSYKPYGWQASAAANVHKVIGLVVDTGGQYRFGSKRYEYMAGPRFNIRTEGVTYFAEVLAGGQYFVPKVGPGSPQLVGRFSMGYGGGIDVKAGKVSIRALQFDWIPYRVKGFPTQWVKTDKRFGFGVVYPFGKMK